MADLSVEKIKEHLAQTSFNPEEEMELGTYNGVGIFSKGQEGFRITFDDVEIDNDEDLEFLVNAPGYIRFLLSQIK